MAENVINDSWVLFEGCIMRRYIEKSVTTIFCFRKSSSLDWVILYKSFLFNVLVFHHLVHFEILIFFYIKNYKFIIRVSKCDMSLAVLIHLELEEDFLHFDYFP